MSERPSKAAATDGELVLDALGLLDVAVVIVDAEGRQRYANGAARKLFGADGLLPTPRAWSREHGFFLPDERTLWALEDLPMVRALNGHAALQVRLFLKNAARPQGVHLLVDAAPIPDGQGATFFFRSARADDDRTRQLLEAERQRAAILDNIRDMAWLKDREGRFIAVNQRSIEMYNLPKERWIGFTDYDVYPHALAERFRADDAEVIRLRQQRIVEEEIVDSNGVSRWLETIKMPVFGADGEVIGTTGTARDITQRKQAEAALRSANESLERRVAERTQALEAAQEALVRRERLAVLGQLAGGVAHQIRNPLGAIMNATSILAHHLRPDDHSDVAESLRVIHEEVRHANVIISGLLDFTRVRMPNRQATSLRKIAEETLRRQDIPDDIVVERDLQQVPELALDADLIESALANLVRNAIEAMPNGGTLKVRVFTSDAHAVVAVIDSGPGLSPDAREHLFEPLRSSKPMGVGLGLLTARTLIEAHDGTVQAVDSPGGAHFELRLPLQSASDRT